MKKSAADIAEVMDGLRALHIGTPSCRALTAQLARVFRVGEGGTLTHEPVRFTGGTETHGIIRIGGPGDGKTSSMRHVVQTCGAFTENSETGMPRYIHITVASPATLRSLACQFLEKLGIDKVSDRAKVYELWTLVHRRLEVMGVTLVVVDEAHDMFRSTGTSEIDSMFRMMKSLMQGEHPVVLLLGGTQRLKEITRQDAQVNRRFRKIISPALDIAADGGIIRKMIGLYASRAGLSAGIRDDLAARLIHGARYRFGRCVEIVLAAVEDALLAGDDTLTGAHFETAWGMDEGCLLSANVFAVDDFMAIELEDDDEIGGLLEEAREKKSRAKRSRNAA